MYSCSSHIVCKYLNFYFIKIVIVLFYLQLYTIVSPLHAQTKLIDSLKQVLPSLSDRARIDCLNELGFEYSNPYWNHSTKVHTDTALFYIIQAQKESQQLNYSKGIGKSFQNLGMVEEEEGDFFKSEYYTKMAIPLLEKDRKSVV